MKKEKIDGKIIIQISILWIFVFAIAFTSVIAFFRNFIFATNDIKTENSIYIEQNENAVDILSLMVENNYDNKKLVNEKRDIPYEIEKKEDDQIPKGEEVIKTKGKVGSKQITTLQQFENNKFVSEEIIESKILK